MLSFHSRFLQWWCCWFCLLIALLLLTHSHAHSAAATPSPEDRVVIHIGDIQVTTKEVERVLGTMPAQYRPYYSGPGRRHLADVIVNNKLLALEAQRRELQGRDSVQLDLTISREAILSAAARKEIENETAVTNEEMQKYLDEHIGQYEEVRVWRIVIRSTNSIPYGSGTHQDRVPSDQEAKAKAQEIKAKLVEGADFEELAAKFSYDGLSSGKGGDLGFIRRGNKVHLIVPPVEEAIFSLKPGTLSDVIQSPLGYEIVKVEEKRVPKLESVRQEIEAQVRKQKSEELLNTMKKGLQIRIDETYFAPASVSKADSKNQPPPPQKP